MKAEMELQKSKPNIPMCYFTEKKYIFGPLPCDHKLARVCFIQTLDSIQGCGKPASKPILHSFQSYAFGVCVIAQFSVNIRNCVLTD